jgi:hypothetical protein
MIDDSNIAGIGTAIFYENTSWLAHIIVKENYRNKGFGTRILQYLCDFCQNNGYKTISLFASEMGYPVYRKYGFEIQAEYVQYEKEKEIDIPKNKNVKTIKKDDLSEIFKLDKETTGENRRNLISEYLNGGYVYKKNSETTGFYLPTLGEGLIIAKDKEAGIELLKARMKNSKKAVLPADNSFGNKFLQENEFKEITRMRRMIYGDRITCRNENIFSRTGSNFG